jgi:hypothetical protein
MTKKILTSLDLRGDILIGGTANSTSGYVLTSNGAGGISWAAASGGSLGYIGTTQSTASSGGTSTLTGVNTFTGVDRSTSSSSAITSTNITFKTGNAVGTLFQTPSATSGNISIVSGDVQGDIAVSGNVTIGNGAVLGYDSDFGSGVAGSVNIGNTNTNAVNVVTSSGFGGINLRNTSGASYITVNSGIQSGISAPIQIGFNNTVATKIFIGSESTTAKVQLLGVILHNYTVTPKTTGTVLYTDLLNGIITCSVGGSTLTLPTGTNMDNIYNDDSNKGFEWSVINTAGSSITVANNGSSHLRVGSGTVAATSSARFMTMRTGLVIWTTYRIS